MASANTNEAGIQARPARGRSASPAEDRIGQPKPESTDQAGTLPYPGKLPARQGALSSGLLRLISNLVGLVCGRQAFVVVNYHRVLAQPEPMLDSEPDVHAFRWQMKLLATCFNVLPLGEALRALEQGTLPARAICITFDDGYRSVHDLALPVLREFGLPATVFITSGVIGAGNMWNDRILHVVQSLPPGLLDLTDLGLGQYQLGSTLTRKRVAGTLSETGKYLPPKKRQALVERLDRLSGRDQEALMLTPEMVLALDNGGIEIGAHTVSHPILTCLEDENAMHEIRAGKSELEAIIGKPVRLFAYPNGKVDKDYDQRHVGMVKEAGFAAAFTTAVGAITRNSDPYQLPRSRPWDASPLRFGLRLLYWLAAVR